MANRKELTLHVGAEDARKMFTSFRGKPFISSLALHVAGPVRGPHAGQLRPADAELTDDEDQQSEDEQEDDPNDHGERAYLRIVPKLAIRELVKQDGTPYVIHPILPQKKCFRNDIVVLGFQCDSCASVLCFEVCKQNFRRNSAGFIRFEQCDCFPTYRNIAGEARERRLAEEVQRVKSSRYKWRLGSLVTMAVIALLVGSKLLSQIMAFFQRDQETAHSCPKNATAVCIKMCTEMAEELAGHCQTL